MHPSAMFIAPAAIHVVAGNSLAESDIITAQLLGKLLPYSCCGELPIYVRAINTYYMLIQVSSQYVRGIALGRQLLHAPTTATYSPFRDAGIPSDLNYSMSGAVFRTIVRVGCAISYHLHSQQAMPCSARVRGLRVRDIPIVAHPHACYERGTALPFLG